MHRICKPKWLVGIILACAAALFFIGTVFAEGEVPETVPIVEVPVEETTEEAGEAPVEEAPPAEEAVVEELLAVETAAVLEPAACPVQTAAVKSSGEATVVSADPWWKVGTTTYKTDFPGNCPIAEWGVTCWESATPIEEALTIIESMGFLPSNRKLYVESGSYPDAININAAGTLLAQLNGIIGEPSVEGHYDSEVTGYFYWYGAANGFTLSGLEFTGNVYFGQNNGTLTLSDLYIHDSGYGLRVIDQNGAIKLNQVRVEDNARYGALLRNGVHPYAGVEVINSSFNNNSDTFNNYTGLEIETNGPVTLKGVSSSNNHGDGLEISGAKSVTIKNSVFSNNDDVLNAGIYGWGIYMDIARNAPVLFEHVHTVHNEGFGIEIKTWGKITFKNVIASDNGAGGARIDNCYLNGSVCENPLFKPVVVNDSLFENNAGNDGLSIQSKSNVTISSIYAYNNNGNGVYINNCNFYDGACQGNGAVKVTSKKLAGQAGVNYFGWNDDDGLHIFTRGKVTLNNFYAIWNGSDGVYIDNNQVGSTAPVIVKSTLPGWVNQTRMSTSRGLVVYSYGTVKVDRLFSYGNGSTGIQLDNDYAGVVKSITVANSDAHQNGGDGIHADSNSSITITNVSATHNEKGLELKNTGGTGNVTVKSSSKNDIYDFTYNSGYGIEILSNGTVKVSNVNVNHSGSDGIHIGDAGTTIYPKSVTITHTESSSNTGNGFTIESAGNITFNTVVGNSNGNSGAYLDNCQLDAGACQYYGKITLLGIGNDFSYNGSYGFWAAAKGNISLTNVDADDNDYNGLYLSNASTGAIGSVVIKTSNKNLQNQFISNGNAISSSNIYILSNGPVTIQDVDSTWATGYGISIQNPQAGIAKPVKILRSLFNYNDLDGIYLNTNSNLIVKDTSASYNDTNGLYVDTDGSVVVSCGGPLGTCSFNNNTTGDGLSIWARKSITITKIVANDNGNGADDHGMDLHNYAAGIDGVADPIKLTNVSVEGNWDHGILAMTEGNVTVKSVLARYNTVGVNIGTSTDRVNNVLVTGTNLFDGNQVGLKVFADGVVTIINVTAQNQTAGAGITVYSYTDGKVVTMKNVIARFNYNDGVYINSQGSVYLHTIISMSNGTSTIDGDGIQVNMTDPVDVLTIRNSAFIFNTGAGIEANINDPVTYTNIKLINTYYMGNDTDSDGINPNLYIY